jgi:hypothetical protein
MPTPLPATETPAAEAETPTVPSWVTDGTFDPTRAWTLIENLREEVATVKAERDTFKADAETARSEAETARAEVETAKTQAEERATAAERSLWTERALRRHPLPEGLSEEDEAELLSFLSGDSEEAVVKKAARLEALRGGPKAKEPEGETPPPALGGLPEAALTPGHGGDPKVNFDAAAIAKTARQRTT